ncbi:MAG: glycosyltransferase family 2 protein, partial [Nitrospirales bacterium]
MPITDQQAAGDLLTLGLFWGFIAYRWVRQRQLRLPEVRPGAAAPVSAPPLVSVIVPARNEAPHVATCVRSLLAQDYQNFEVIVVDDGSDDGTGALVAEFAKADPRLTLIEGAPLPDGWLGKAHACVQGYRRARGDWLLFTDADTEHAPWLLSGVMAEVRRSPAAFATVIGTQRHPTVGAFLANLPVFTYIYLVTDPAAWLDPRSRQSLVNGQYLL